MDSFTSQHYIPILKTKAGDLWALRTLSESTAAMINPILEFTPPSPNQSFERTLGRRMRAIRRALGRRPFFLDFNFIDDDPQTGQHPLTIFWQEIGDTDLSAVPVTGTRRSPQYQAATRIAAERVGELMVRLTLDDVRSPKQTRQRLDAIQNLFGLSPSQIHLTLDLRSLIGANHDLLALAVPGAINAIPDIQEWRNVILASGSFPPSLPEAVVDREEWTRIPREEWLLWRTIRDAGNLDRSPCYSDYAVGDPDLPFSGPAYFTVSLRYAHDDDFFVWCGRAARDYDDGNEQIYLVCEDLIERPEYAGFDFSAGDREIHERATTQDSPGNAGSWRQWGTSHYLEMVVSQLASLDDV